MYKAVDETGIGFPEIWNGQNLLRAVTYDKALSPRDFSKQGYGIGLGDAVTCLKGVVRLGKDQIGNFKAVPCLNAEMRRFNNAPGEWIGMVC